MLDQEKLKAVISAVLNVDIGSIGPDSSRDTIESWDSLRHLNLILALEEEFGVTLPDEDGANATSYQLLVIVLRELLESK